MKIKWKVSEKPSGPYRSFYNRAWPDAYYDNAGKDPAAAIYCSASYDPSQAKTGDHPPLTLMIADHSVPGPGFTWRKVKGEFKTLQEAKDKAEELIEKYPNIHPKLIPPRRKIIKL